MAAVSNIPVQVSGTLSLFHTDLFYASSKWQQLVAHLQRLVEPLRRSELAYNERKASCSSLVGWLVLLKPCVRV